MTKITFINPKTGQFESIEMTEEKAEKSRAKFLNDAYNEGRLSFIMMDFSNGDILFKTNMNPKFRENEK